MSEQKPPQLPGMGSAGSGRRATTPNDLADTVAKTAATVRVLSRDFLDLGPRVDEASARATAAGQSAAKTAADLVTLADAVTGHVTTMGGWRTNIEAMIEELAEDEERPKSQPSWLTIDDPNQAMKLLSELAGWVAAVWARFPQSRLPNCWAYHPWVVAELLGVWGAWKHAYVGRASCPVRVEEWLHRWRPDTAARIRDGVGGCSLDDHGPTGKLSYLPATVPGGEDHLDDVAAWWAESHGGTWAPAPTRAMLADERAQEM